MASEDKKLTLFEEAMQKVYGPYDPDAPNAKWQPPSNPGAGGHRGRYLWTDAFGVINFITLSRERPAQAQTYLDLAEQLAHAVHSILGRARDGSARLPDATDEEPLKGGLRIGKMDEEGGPDGDGQYHHYLTLWMFALSRLALATGEVEWNALAVQLAKAIHPRFLVPTAGPSGRLTMVWKISTDMREVLVPVKGNLDDVTGYVVYRLLQETQARLAQDSKKNARKAAPRDSSSSKSLEAEIEQYRRIMEPVPKSLSGDPLDLGMSLWVCHLDREAAWSRELAEAGLAVARDKFLPSSSTAITRQDRYRRLAFREFGACLGIKCYDGDKFRPLLPATEAVLDVWKDKLLEGGDEDLRPINLVMYAAALIPGAFRKDYFQ
ncbi:hypothetical protein F4778DRAFT_786434 [Xylariomycetidae sp. FL2044]|nr:hypothetical protein F4778DRAFT_786434 [Xylariomycetidae sp. FL2044]